ncbi:MAG: hypothetical protein U0871_24690 [Gemmataceae bacterium]
MKTYQVTLPDEFAAFVDRMIAEKKWETADNLLLYGVALVQNEIESESDEDVERLRALLQPAIDSLDRGEGVDGDAVFAQLLAKLEAARKQPI